MEAPIYNVMGKKAGSIALPEGIFDVKWNDALMHQVVTSMQDNARTPTADTKDRGDVSGGGKKPWKQKGTGRARHGSIRSPIWKGGGVTHGPLKEKNYARAVPKKMRAKALLMALSRKWKDGAVILVESFGFEAPKTALAKRAIVALSGIEGFSPLGSKRKNAGLVALADPSAAVVKSFRNIGSVESKSVRDLNPVAVLKYRYLIVENPAAAFAIIGERSQRSSAKKSVARASKKSSATN